MLLLIGCYGFSQVGIGTTTPTAELEIQTSDVGNSVLDIPALEINPQVSHVPTGSTTGQISVIGDKLFMYDGTRAKWLSIEVSSLSFGRSGNSDNVNLRTAGNQSSNRSGYLMPFDGTITYASIKSNDNSGAQAKQFSIQIRNGNTTNSATNVSTVASEYSSTTLNIDFSTGDYVNVRINNDGNGNINNVGAVIWVKWRQ